MTFSQAATETIKRLADLSLASIGLILLSPLIFTTALLIRVTMGGPVFFRQQRPGRGQNPFTLLKFRTMTEATDRNGDLLPDGKRLHPVGMFLRRTSLDELPQLWNILKGDMSLVGPRPLLMDYLVRYSPEQRRRHEVRPGLTGWAQVNGRNAISWDEKFTYDVWYVDHRSLMLDLKILFLTFVKLFRRDGISAEGSATMPEFLGSESRSETHIEVSPR